MAIFNSYVSLPRVWGYVIYHDIPSNCHFNRDSDDKPSSLGERPIFRPWQPRLPTETFASSQIVNHWNFPKGLFSVGKQMLNYGHPPFLGGDAKKEHTAKSWQLRQKQKGKGCWKNCNQRSFRRNFGTFLWCLQLFRSNPTRPSISAHLWVWTPIFEDVLGQLLE